MHTPTSNLSNGRPIDPEVAVPEFNDENLSAFKTAAQLGNYLEACGVYYHGVGHMQNCDLKDQYCNCYSVRFYGWHKWIDSLFQRLNELGRPLFDPALPLDSPLSCSAFQPLTPPEPYLSGTWILRSFHHETDASKDPIWWIGEMKLKQTEDGLINGELSFSNPARSFQLIGHVDENNVYYETTPDWWDERAIIVLKAVSAPGENNPDTFEFRGNIQGKWPSGHHQFTAFTGSVICTHLASDPSARGKTGSFIATKCADLKSSGKRSAVLPETRSHIFNESGVFVVPAGVTEVHVKVWGAGGGGGSDGPGVGGDDGKLGGTSRFGRFCYATGGQGGQHGVYQLGKGGKGGSGFGGSVCKDGEDGEAGNTQPNLTGKGGDGAEGGDGGARVSKLSNGLPGALAGGGGSGAQEGRSPGGGGGGGGFTEGAITVVAGSTIKISVGEGGRGGDGGYRVGGDGANGRIEITWTII